MGTIVVRPTADSIGIEFYSSGHGIYEVDLRAMDTVGDLLQHLRFMREKQWYDDTVAGEAFSALNLLFERVTGTSVIGFLKLSSSSSPLEWAKRVEQAVGREAAHGAI